jgi:hypothetical protein
MATAGKKRLWGAQTRSPSRRHAVLVNQSAESIPPAHAIDPARSNDAEGWSRLRRRESETAMRSIVCCSTRPRLRLTLGVSGKTLLSDASYEDSALFQAESR